MNHLEINLHDGREAFDPGEELTGTVHWQLDCSPQTAELRLFWFTRGKGTEDAGVVETVRFDHPLERDTRSFRFQLPPAPYSFSGKLISLVWALELVTQSPDEVTRREIVVAPGRREVELGTAEVPGRRERWYERFIRRGEPVGSVTQAGPE
ncbi:MAG TPA: hypothetical protein GYA07_08880 [Verrucomicrobia bacterium]|nr:hypothetical protein [Verrucomicrobiota bacterium]HOB32416.1 hypothetical protein [Verrucomicrobiota bacterium]HOP98247.1 hypothetical protein [Verrucomicrobiota bacterium]HPU57815.1 hypothetical protein [Verrucomicrobiota bacterium]